MRRYKSVHERSLEKLLKDPDPKISLGAAQQLTVLSGRRDRQAKKAAKAAAGLPDWLAAMSDEDRSMWRVIMAAEGKLKRWDLAPLNSDERALLEASVAAKA